MNVLYCNNTRSDLSPWHKELLGQFAARLQRCGDLADLFTVTVVHGVNDDGSPRYIIDAA